MGFRKSKRIGDEGESFLIRYLERLEIVAEKNLDLTNAHKYDIMCRMGRQFFTGEVKFDKMAVETGNIAIEVFNTRSQTASGITSTEADLWFHLVLDGNNITCWFNKTSVVLDFINNTRPKRVVERAGDGNAKILLYSIEDILGSVLLRLENLEIPKAKRLIKEVLKL